MTLRAYLSVEAMSQTTLKPREKMCVGIRLLGIFEQVRLAARSHHLRTDKIAVVIPSSKESRLLS